MYDGRIDMPEKIAGFLIALIIIGTIYSSFGLQWPKLVKQAYWGLFFVIIAIYVVG